MSDEERCHPGQRNAATFGDHQRVCKVSSMPEACGWVTDDVRFELKGVRCGLPMIVRHERERP
jgi:hypothetical protein